MFQAVKNAVAGHSKLKSLIVTGAVLAGLGVPTAAFADHHEHHWFHGGIAIPVPEIIVPVTPVVPCPSPAVITTSNQVWVPAVYQNVTEKVYVPDVTTTQLQRVEVPAEYGSRDVIRIGIFGPRVHHERYLISPAHLEDRQVSVVVTPAHFEYQTHQQLVSDGHWETQVYEVR